MILRAVYMEWVFDPYPAARYVDTAPLVVLGAFAAAVLAELILQLFSRRRRRTRLRDRAFGVSMFFSAAIFIEFGKMAGEYSGGAHTAVWAAAFASALLLSNLQARYCRYERLSTRQAVKVMTAKLEPRSVQFKPKSKAKSARRQPVQPKPKAKSPRRSVQFKPKAKSPRRPVQPKPKFPRRPVQPKPKANIPRRPMKPQVAYSPSWQYHARGQLLYRGWKHKSTRRRDSASSRKRAYAYGSRQPARAV